jgi:hypothetical protein
MKTAVFRAFVPAAALAFLCIGCNEPIQAILQDDYTVGRIILVDEPANFSPTGTVPSWCYGKIPEVEISPVPWITGHTGQGINLGNGTLRTQLRFYGSTSGHQALLSWDSGAVTFNTWIYWKGAGTADGEGTPNSDDHSQVIFGIFGTGGNFRVSINDDKDIVAGSNHSYSQGNVTGLLAQVNFGTTYVPAKSATPLPQNSWHMVTATLSGTELTLYLDGIQIAVTSCTTKMTDLNLGGFRMGSSNWAPPTLNAVIDDASWWRGVALSPAAIKQLYDDTK